MSEMATALGLPVEFEFEGEKYEISGRDFEIEAYYVRWLQSHELKILRMHSSEMTPAEYEMHLTNWRRDCTTGVYDLGSLDGWRSLLSLPGRKQMALLQLQKGSGRRATMDLVERIFDNEQALSDFTELQKMADGRSDLPKSWTKASNKKTTPSSSSLSPEDRELAMGPLM